MSTKSKEIVSSFIEEIWNQRQFNKIDQYLHSEFTDHSLPPALPANKDGLMQWIMGTNKAFEHTTIIEEMVCEDNKLMLKIKFLLRHVGKWRDIEPTGAEVQAIGYRYFKLKAGKIIEHWALVDGNSIENQLKEATHGCKMQA